MKVGSSDPDSAVRTLHPLHSCAGREAQRPGWTFPSLQQRSSVLRITFRAECEPVREIRVAHIFIYSCPSVRFSVELQPKNRNLVTSDSRQESQSTGVLRGTPKSLLVFCVVPLSCRRIESGHYQHENSFACDDIVGRTLAPMVTACQYPVFAALPPKSSVTMLFCASHHAAAVDHSDFQAIHGRGGRHSLEHTAGQFFRLPDLLEQRLHVEKPEGLGPEIEASGRARNPAVRITKL